MKKFIFPLLLFATFLISCSSPQNPEFKTMENVKFKSASISKTLNFTLTADAIFYNPNAGGINISALDLDIMINKKKVSKIRQNVSAKIGSNSDFTLPIEFDVPLAEVFKDLNLSIGTIFKKQEIDYHIKGTATVNVVGIDIDIPVDHEGKEELKLSTDFPLINF
ncbi:MAG: LEA14-like dessication related protein [Maribacter sp.]|jgi:LEA14-like dessication related protein